jgi:hypothetical protein
MQKDDSYHRLFAASLRLLSSARMMRAAEFNHEWNKLDAVSDSVRAEIFKNVAQGIGFMMQHAALTDVQLYNVWKLNFPDATEEDYDDFRAGITKMAKFRQFAQASLADAFDVAGIEQTPDQPDGTATDDVNGDRQNMPDPVQSGI